jgi:lipopolysaccharide export system permease protein
MFKIYQRYLSSIFIPPFLLGTVFFSIFLLIFQIFRFIKYLVAKDIAIFEILSLIGNMAIFFLPMAIPLSALLATIYSLGRLSDDSEIVALRSLGTSREKLFLPFFILSVLIAATLFSLNSEIIPASNFFVKNTFERIASKSMLGQIRPEEFFTDIPGITLFSEKVQEGGSKLKNLFIFVENDREEKMVFAKEGILRNTDDLINFEIELIDGNILRINPHDKSSIEKILFKKYKFPPFEESPSFSMVTKDSMLSNAELRKLIAEKKSKLKNPEDKISLYRTQLDYYSRFISPLQVILFVLLGFSLGIKGNGRESKSVTAPVILVVGVYIFLFFFGISLAKKAILLPVLATFGPTVLLALACLYFYRRMNWVN